jgi:hypothetical protein
MGREVSKGFSVEERGFIRALKAPRKLLGFSPQLNLNIRLDLSWIVEERGFISALIFHRLWKSADSSAR